MRLPKNRAPVHPGTMLQEEFLTPLGLSQSEAARRLGVSFPRLHELLKGKRGVTSDTALRLERVFGMEAQFWLNLQLAWDLWHLMRSPAGKEISKLEPIRMKAS